MNKKRKHTIYPFALVGLIASCFCLTDVVIIIFVQTITKPYIAKSNIVIMNIKSLFARIRTCCNTTKEEKEKAPKQVIKDTKSDFPEDLPLFLPLIVCP